MSKKDIGSPAHGDGSRMTPRKGRGRPRGDQSRVGRDGLIVATREILKHEPPSTITRQMIAERAGVDPTLIRYYFGTVDHLIAYTVVDTYRRIRPTRTGPGATTDPRERARERIGALVDMFIDNPQHHQIIMHVLYGSINDPGRADLVAALRPSVEYTAAQLNSGSYAGAFRDVDPHMFHIIILAMTEFLGRNADFVADLFKGRETARTIRDRYVDFIVAMLFDGIGAR